MAEVGLVRLARLALEVSRAVVPAQRTKFSKRQFTQPQLLAVLCLMRYEDWTFRETEVRLSEHAELRSALELRSVPDRTTLYRFLVRLDPEDAARVMNEIVRRMPGRWRSPATVAVDATGLAQAVLADAEFDSERNHTFCRQQLGAGSVIPAKRFTTRHATGVRAQMRENFPRKLYGRRSIIESVFSAVKRKLSCRAPGRSLHTQSRQALLLGLTFNLYRLWLPPALPIPESMSTKPDGLNSSGNEGYGKSPRSGGNAAKQAACSPSGIIIGIAPGMSCPDRRSPASFSSTVDFCLAQSDRWHDR